MHYKKIISYILSILLTHATISGTQEFGYLYQLITNMHWVEVQTLDTGHDPRIIHYQDKGLNTRDPDMLNCSGELDTWGGKYKYAQIGCYPYIFMPNTLAEMSGMVFPFHMITNGLRYIKITVFNDNGSPKNIMYLKDIEGKLCFKKHVPGQLLTMQTEWTCTIPKQGDMLTLVVGNVHADGEIEFTYKEIKRDTSCGKWDVKCHVEKAGGNIRQGAQIAWSWAKDQAEKIKAFFEGIDWEAIVKQAAKDALKQTNFDVDRLGQNIKDISGKDGIEKITAAIPKLKESVVGDTGIVTKGKAIAALASQFAPKLEELETFVKDPETIKKAFADPGAAVKLGSELVQKKFEEIKEIYENILKTADEIHISTLFEQVHNLLSGVKVTIRSMLEIRSNVGGLDRLLYDGDTRDILTSLLEHVTTADEDIQEILEGKMNKPSDIEKVLINKLIDHVFEIVPAVKQIMTHIEILQKITPQFPVAIATMREQIDPTKEIVHDIVPHIHWRIKHEMKQAGFLAGNIAAGIFTAGLSSPLLLVQAIIFAKFSLNDSTNEIKEHLVIMVQGMSDLLGLVTALINQASPILTTLQEKLDIEVVTPPMMKGLKKLSTHIKPVRIDLQQLRVKFGAKAEEVK